MKSYDPKKIEKKWQAAWKKSRIYEAGKNVAGKNSAKNTKTQNKSKFYGLIEFPYPSGDGLHVGHIRSNTAMDIISRKRRMGGHDVLYPIGWDAFGLPTENYALKTGIAPGVVTKKNTDTFRRQLQALGFSFDWSREINTTDPGYYHWTQWIFIQMWKAGLAYKAKMAVNWCPKDKIVLANEEVINGCCERCGTPVEKREKEQWMLAITKYADRLDKDLDTVDYLPQIKTQQRNWIGRSEGAEIDFTLVFKKNPADNDRRGLDGKPAHLSVFTTRADTLFGATYLVLAPEHVWVTLATDDAHDVLLNKEEVKNYIASVKNRPEMERTAENKEKTGVELKGVMAINPATGKEIPLFVADYVLGHYGTGAVMAVPAHDERDWQFAKKYNLPIKEVIIPKLIDAHDPPMPGKKTVERKAIQAIVIDPATKKVLCLRWKKFPWTTFITGGVEGDEDLVEAAKREIFEETGYKNARFVRMLGGPIESHFYANHKDENRKALFSGMVFEIDPAQHTEISAEEKDKHEPVWLSWDEIAKDRNIKCSEYETYLDRFFNPPHPFIASGVLHDSAAFSGLTSEEAKKKIVEAIGGKIVTTYKLRDWVFSRQRYWGEPIPMVFCEACAAKASPSEKNTGRAGWLPLPEKNLPLKLPKVAKYQPTDTGESPLAADTPAMNKWRLVKCPECGGVARRETDTMPQWAGSSWYFLRYADPENKRELAAPAALKHWQPVDWYNGGMEHTTLHLLYSRFWNKFLYDIGVAPTSEPYAKRTSHGLILAADGEKMSKSRGNVVSPDDIVKNVGADTLRLYEMFMGPFDQPVSWSTDGIVGPRRFLEKVWRLAEKVGKSNDKNLESLTYKTLKKVSADIEAMQFNTAVSAMMILANDMEKVTAIPQELYEIFLKMLAPFAPHITEELWRGLGHKKSIHIEPWPQVDESKIQTEEVTIVVQINGKVRGQFSAPPAIAESDATGRAKELETVKKWLAGKEIKKTIYISGRLVNFVVE